MSLRRQKSKDSLDLLLDTMCNTFGGIILIAILVALLSGGPLQLAPPTAETEVVQLREQARTELQRLQLVSAQLHQHIQAEGLDRRVELLRQRETAQTRIAALTRQLKTEQVHLHNLEAQNPRERQAAVEMELEQLEEQAAKIQQTADGLQGDIATRQHSLVRMQAQTRSVLESSVLRLRYPKERFTSKHRYYVLVKYGRLYPTELPGGERNRRTIDWTERGDDSLARPRAAAGIDPAGNPGQAEAVFAELNSASRYIAFIVSPDSFATFSAAQRYCVRHDLEFGWSPTTESYTAFSSTGKNPLPQ